MKGTHLLARLASCAFAAGMIASAAPVQGYRMIQNTNTGRVTAGTPVTCSTAHGFTHWNARTINWRLNTAGQGSGKETAVQAALQSWTDVSGAKWVLNYSGTTSAGWATDGINTLLWAQGNGCVANCLAITALILQSGQSIIESDVSFNSAYTWSTVGSDHDTQAVAAHELGHSLGIHHTELTSTPLPTMNATYFGTAGRSLEADDKSALICSFQRYCSLTGSGATFAGQRYGDLFWNSGCTIAGANVDVFRDGLLIATDGNYGGYVDIFASSATSANYWVCEAGETTWYNSSSCSNVVTVHF